MHFRRVSFHVKSPLTWNFCNFVEPAVSRTSFSFPTRFLVNLVRIVTIQAEIVTPCPRHFVVRHPGTCVLSRDSPRIQAKLGSSHNRFCDKKILRRLRLNVQLHMRYSVELCVESPRKFVGRIRVLARILLIINKVPSVQDFR